MRRTYCIAFITVLSTTACTGEAEQEPGVASLRLTVGSQTITISDNGTVTGGPIVVTMPATSTVTAAFLNTADVQDPVAHNGEFELGAVPASTAILAFTRTGDMTGTLSGVAAGSTTLSLSLFHKAAQHEDFGPFDVSVTVN